MSLSHPLHQRLRRIANRARRLTLSHAVGWFATVVLLACLLVGLLDFLLRSDDAPIRFLASGAIVAALGWAFLRFVRPAASRRLSDLQVANRIERRFPKLGGQVSNTVAFLAEEANDPLAGSYAMRRAVINKTMASLESINLSDCLDSRSARRAVGAALLTASALGVVCAAAPLSASHAATRLLQPWGNHPWPRRNALDLRDPPKMLAKGADFEVEIFDRNGRMPESVTLEIWRDDEKPQSRDATFVGGKMLARVNNVSKPFRYRAVGGDDDSMPWRRLDVVQPPAIISYVATVTPPEYSGWPAESFTDDIRGLVGSQVAIQGETDQRLHRAVLKFQPSGGNETQVASTLLLVNDSGFRSPTGLWPLQASGEYWLELTDTRGVQSNDSARWNVEAITDAAPTVAFDSSRFSRFATTAAVVPLVARVQDDLAVRRAELRFRRAVGGEAPHEVVPLWQRDAAPQRESAHTVDEQIDVKYRWRLDAVPGLQPGDVLELELAGVDFAGQQGVSAKQRLSIVSRAELEDRLGRNQAHILERIAEALRAQQESRKQLTALEIQWTQTQAFSKADGDQLQSAELNQRQVTRFLAGPQNGAMLLIEMLKQDIANNRLNNPELERRVQRLADGVDEVVKQLPAIHRPLLSSLKDVRPVLLEINGDSVAPIAPATATSMQTAGIEQDKAIAALEALLGEMTQWENYRRFAREVGRIQREQDDIERKTDELRLKTLTQDIDALTPEQRAKLMRLAQQQLGLAQRLDKLQSRMSKAGKGLEDEDPLTAETLADGVKAAQRMAISGQMRESARRLGVNQVGQAKQRQAEVKDGLDELLNILGNRREDELERQLRKLGELDRELTGMQQQEQAIADQMSEARAANDKRRLERLAEQQQQLAKEAEQAARRLERLEAQKASQAANQAAQAMQASGQSGQQSDSPQAQEEAEQQAQSALEKLQQARQQLAQQMQQTQQDLFFERLARLEQKIRGLSLRQESILATVRELKTAEEDGELSREQLVTLKSAAQHQSDLSVEAGDAGESVAQAEVFSLALQAAAREMARASRYLETEQLASAEQAELRALSRLEQILEALKPEPPQPNSDPPPPAGQGGQQNPPPADAINQLAQLKLVKLLQEEIRRRTAELQKLSVSRPLSPGQLTEYGDLSAEQGRLADIIDNLIESAQEAARKAAEDDSASGDSLEQDLLKDLNSDPNDIEIDPAPGSKSP